MFVSGGGVKIDFSKKFYENFFVAAKVKIRSPPPPPESTQSACKVQGLKYKAGKSPKVSARCSRLQGLQGNKTCKVTRLIGFTSFGNFRHKCSCKIVNMQPYKSVKAFQDCKAVRHKATSVEACKMAWPKRSLCKITVLMCKSCTKHFENRLGLLKGQGASLTQKKLKSTSDDCKVQGLHMGDFGKTLGRGNKSLKKSLKVRGVREKVLILGKTFKTAFFKTDSLQDKMKSLTAGENKKMKKNRLYKAALNKKKFFDV